MFQQRDPQGNTNDRLTICSALIDWADPDDNLFSCDLSTNSAPSGNAKEDAYYQLLARRRTSARTRRTATRSKSCTWCARDERRLLGDVRRSGPRATPKKRAITVWSQGAVNVNTANPLTLLGLICSAAKPGVAPAPTSSGGSPTPAPVPTAPPVATSNTAPAAGVNPNLPAICSDPNQTSLFTMGLTMAKGITMGAPLFGSPDDFISTMKGQGMLGPLLTALGMQPVAFTSESDFKKSITVESKMFSIYAVGVVKGYKLR